MSNIVLKLPPAVPEGWEAQSVENDGFKGFIVRSPRADGVQHGTAVFENSEDPAENLLYLLLAYLERSGLISEINTPEIIAWAQDIERRQGTDLQPSNRASSIAAAICDTLSDGYDSPRPTHYAVIDEHGEIVQAFKVASYRNADILCKSLITSMGYGHDTSDWTVKGVTVHE